MGARWLVAAALAWASATAWADSGTKDEPKVIVRQVGDVRVELREGNNFDEDPTKWPAVVGIGADGTELWRIDHPAQYGQFAEPVVVGSHIAYARKADLLDLDVERGTIVGRYRFPAYITELRRDTGAGAPTALWVRLRDEGILAPTGPEVDIRYRLGDAPPGRSPWYPMVQFAAHSDASALWPGDSWDHSLADARRADPLGPEQAAATAARYTRALERDETNPFLHFFLGRALAAAGRADEARAAFDAAVDVPAATWADLIMLYAQLEVRGLPQAERAFERGLDRMRQAGVRPERTQSLWFTFLLLRGATMWLTAEALESGDAERLHALESRRWRLAPKLELGPQAWRAIASWMRDRGRPDLAEVWSDRARAAEDGWINRANRDSSRALERTFPFLLGLLYAVPLALLLVGIRSTSERFGWRTGARAFATVAAPAVIGFLVAAWPPIWREVATRDFPDDNLGAPRVVSALEEQPAGPARDDVLAYARAQMAAVQAGANYEGPLPDEETIADALAPTPTWWQSLREADRVAVANMPWYHIDTVWTVDHPLEIAVLLLIPLVIGLLLARFAPRAARLFTDIVPGAARGFSAASGLAMGLFLGAAIAATGCFHRFWESDAGRYLGLDAIWNRGLDRPSNAWAWFLVLGILALQLWLVVRARRRRRTAARTESPA